MSEPYQLSNLGTCRIQLIRSVDNLQINSVDLKYMTKSIKPVDIYKGVENINDEVIKEEIKQRIGVQINIPNNVVANTRANIHLLYGFLYYVNIGNYYLRVYPDYYASYALQSIDFWDCVIDGYPEIKQIKSNLNLGHIIALKCKSRYPEYFFPKMPATAVTTNPFGMSNAPSNPDFIIGKPELILNIGFETAGLGGADIFDEWIEDIAGGGTITDEVVKIHSGAHAANLTENAGESILKQAFTVVAETNYRLTFWTRGDTAVGGQYAVYDVTNAGDILVKTNTDKITAVYEKITYDFATPAGCVSVRVLLYSPSAAAGNAYFDDVSCQIR